MKFLRLFSSSRCCNISTRIFGYDLLETRCLSLNCSVIDILKCEFFIDKYSMNETKETKDQLSLATTFSQNISPGNLFTME